MSEFAQGSALPFKTQDAILANCLRAAGFTETPISPLNLFTTEILFKLGAGLKDKDGNVTRPSRYAGLNIVETARRAYKEGQRGCVEYHFEHHADIKKFCQIYADQCREIDEGEVSDASTRLFDIIGGARPTRDGFTEIRVHLNPMDSREKIFRVLCIALKLRIEYVNRWKQQVPYLVVKDPGAMQSQKTPDGGRIETRPGGTMVPVTAPDQTFRNLGLI